MDSVSLTSLALLKIRLDDQSGDAYSVFEPLVTDMLCKLRLADITDEQVAESFTEVYGLHIPTASMHHVLRRLARQGYLERSYGKYHLTEKAKPIDALAARRLDAEQNTQKVVSEFVDYCDKEFSRKVSNDEAVSSILGFLDKFSVDCLRAYVFQSSLPKPKDAGVRDEYAVARFVYWASEEDRPLFDRIILLVQCQMCANAVLCPDLQSLDKKFGNVSFYLDAPLLLNLTGLHGDPAKRSTEQLLELVGNLDGQIFTFEHSTFEAQTIIANAKPHFYNYEMSTRLLRACRDAQMQLSDIELVEESFERRMRGYGINIVPTPEYVEDFQVSEQDLEAFIRERVVQATDRATRLDINSIRSIFVLRRGVLPVRLEDAAHVFVTDNGALARAAWDYSKEHNSFKEVSPLISDYSLANIAWLKAPLESPDLPTIEALSLCYAAMKPKKGFEHKMLQCIDTLRDSGHITASAHAAMRTSRAYEQELMRLTLGDEDALKPATAMAALERLKDELTLEHVSRITDLQAEKSVVAEELDNVHGALEQRDAHANKVSGFIATGIGVVLYGLFLWISISVATREFGTVAKDGMVVIAYWAVGIVLNVAAIYGFVFELRRRLSKLFVKHLFGIEQMPTEQAKSDID